jgi:hypothetical protein
MDIRNTAEDGTVVVQDLNILKTAGANVLMVGPDETVEQLLAELLPHLESPVVCGTRDIDALTSSTDTMGTVVIRDVDGLSASQQQRLSCWLEHAPAAPVRIVSTTSVPLFELVEAGLFPDVLYYRLNTVLLDLRPFQGG